MLKVNWRKLSRFFEIKIELEDAIKIEMSGLLDDVYRSSQHVGI
jgi:hypothetical protein